MERITYAETHEFLENGVFVQRYKVFRQVVRVAPDASVLTPRPPVYPPPGYAVPVTPAPAPRRAINVPIPIQRPPQDPQLTVKPPPPGIPFRIAVLSPAAGAGADGVGAGAHPPPVLGERRPFKGPPPRKALPPGVRECLATESLRNDPEPPLKAVTAGVRLHQQWEWQQLHPPPPKRADPPSDPAKRWTLRFQTKPKSPPTPATSSARWTLRLQKSPPPPRKVQPAPQPPPPPPRARPADWLGYL